MAYLVPLDPTRPHLRFSTICVIVELAAAIAFARSALGGEDFLVLFLVAAGVMAAAGLAGSIWALSGRGRVPRWQWISEVVANAVAFGVPLLLLVCC